VRDRERKEGEVSKGKDARRMTFVSPQESAGPFVVLFKRATNKESELRP